MTTLLWSLLVLSVGQPGDAIPHDQLFLYEHRNQTTPAAGKTLLPDRFYLYLTPGATAGFLVKTDSRGNVNVGKTLVRGSVVAGRLIGAENPNDRYLLNSEHEFVKTDRSERAFYIFKVQEPESQRNPTWRTQTGPLLYVFYFVFGVLFFALSAQIGKVYCRRSLKSKNHAPTSTSELVVGVVAVAGCGYLCFWLYFANRYLGLALSGAWFCLAGAALVRAARELRWKTLLATTGGAAAIRLTLLVGMFYLSCLDLFSSGRDLDCLRGRFLSPFQTDYFLPFLLARLVRGGESLIPFYADWISSDRPPLQAGMYLLFSWDNSRVFYHALAVLFQGLWVVGVCHFCDVLQLSKREKNTSLFVLIFSGFCLFNTLYVWPKLLAGALGLMSLSFLVQWTKTEAKQWAVFSGASFGLALLAHPGVVFALPCHLAVLLAGSRRSPASYFRTAAWAVVPLVALLLPWQLYQKFYDPPGNRLLKWHLAGVIPLDERGLLQTLRDSYSNLNLESWLVGRWESVQTILGLTGFDPASARAAEAQYLVRTPGVAILAVLVAMFYLFRRIATGKTLPGARMISYLSLGVLASVALWVVLMFLPKTTVVFQGSYLMVLVFFVVLGYFIAQSKWILFVIAPLHAIWFFWVWVLLNVPADYGQAPLSPPYSVFLFLCAGLIVCDLYFLGSPVVAERPAGNGPSASQQRRPAE